MWSCSPGEAFEHEAFKWVKKKGRQQNSDMLNICNISSTASNKVRSQDRHSHYWPCTMLVDVEEINCYVQGLLY